MAMALDSTLTQILSSAYRCPAFDAECSGEMRWQPDKGHVPRGFAGAIGTASEVELVLLFSEPGEPKPERDNFAGEHMRLVYEDANNSFRTGRDLFHRNVRRILNLCWPFLSFDDQMRRTWLTESVLCSARKTTGPVSKNASLACGNRYLRPQLAVFRNALLVALGVKAAHRLRQLEVHDFIEAFAVGPPGCNQSGALPSWVRIADEIKRRRERNDA
jgi:hypothetical protein